VLHATQYVANKQHMQNFETLWLPHRRQAANMLQHQPTIIIYMGLWPGVLFALLSILHSHIKILYRHICMYTRVCVCGWLANCAKLQIYCCRKSFIANLQGIERNPRLKLSKVLRTCLATWRRLQ